MKTIFKLLLSLTLINCENENVIDTITFENNSKIDLYVSMSFVFPDTNMYFPNPFLDPSTNLVEAETISTSALRVIHGNYRSRLLDVEKLLVFVFDAEVLKTVPWDTVKANYMVSKRYDLSLDDLESMDWTIKYP